MKFNRLLESKSLIHNVLIFDRYHAIVHIGRQFILFGLFLIVETRISRAKWIHLVTLTNLEA